MSEWAHVRKQQKSRKLLWKTSSHLWAVSVVEFLCCSEPRWPPQTNETTCPTSSASEIRLDSAHLQEWRKQNSVRCYQLFIYLNFTEHPVDMQFQIGTCCKNIKLIFLLPSQSIDKWMVISCSYTKQGPCWWRSKTTGGESDPGDFTSLLSAWEGAFCCCCGF